jgi:glycosyltransferase involved in cell wall biosynthesis
MTEEPLVSVIVPTRNSGRTILRCLESIRSQTYPRIELVVVDNGSTDATPSLSSALADLFVTGGRERSAQRNLGAARATGEYLLFVDSDMVLEPKVVQECVAVLEAVDAAVIPETSFGEGLWARCKALERSCYLGDETIEAARFFRRETFEAAGRYDESMDAGEDWDLHARARLLGARLGRTEALIQHDEGSLQLRGLVKKKFAYGKTMTGYRRKHPELARLQLRLLRPAFLRNRRTLAASPLTTGAMLTMKFCEFAAGGAGLAVGKLSGRADRRAQRGDNAHAA